MATSITPATLTVTITESVTLNGSDRGSTATLTIANVAETDNRIVNVGTAEVDIIGFAAANAQGAFVRTDVKYIRLTNLDDTNYVTIGSE
jgi:transketolase C-terminal domain/subunit